MNQQVMLSATEAQQKTKEPVTVQLQFEQYVDGIDRGKCKTRREDDDGIYARLFLGRFYLSFGDNCFIRYKRSDKKD